MKRRARLIGTTRTRWVPVVMETLQERFPGYSFTYNEMAHLCEVFYWFTNGRPSTDLVLRLMDALKVATAMATGGAR